MTTWCPCCEQWSVLPADGGQGDSPCVLCQHCEATLRVESRYRFCGECSRYHRTDYDSCPFCTVNGISVLATAQESAFGKYTLEPKKRRAKRGDGYYWQLYLDYKDKAPAPPLDLDETSHPPVSTNNGSSHAGANGNGYTLNGSSPANGHGPNDSSIANGVSGGTLPPSNGSAHVDLAITDSLPQTLFSEDENSRMLHESGTVPTTVSAGNFNEFDYELIQDPSRLAEVAEQLSCETVIGVDTETTGLDPHTSELLLLQVSTADKVYIVDCRRLVPLALKPLLENPRISKIAQNAKFEYEMLRQQVGITLANIYDTMLAERLLTAGISREISLKMIAHKYIGATLDKSVREAFYKLAGNGDAYLGDDQLHYAARDAFIMMPIWRQQAPELKKHKLEQVADLEFQCIAAVGDMELAGVQIDEVRWRKIISDVQVQRDRTAAELAELLEPATMQATMFGVSAINLNSNTQLVEAFSTLGVDLPDTMEATLSKFNHPAVTKLLEYRGQEKMLSAFGESVLSLINPKTRRIHPDFNQYGADTGRFSCTRPNVQQIPATSDFRKCFVAAPGYKLVTCDYSQCIAVDTWVGKEGSWVKIQDHPQSISKGISETLVLTTDRKYNLECTPDHRILTHRGWVEASSLQEGDWVALAGAKVAEAEPFDDQAWLMGFWVGDGSMNRSPGSIYFAKGQEPHASEVRQFIWNTLGEEPRSWGESFAVTNQRAYADKLRSLFNKKDLRLPLNRLDNLSSLLSGLFDADGNVDVNGIYLATKWRGLAQDVQLALLRYGIMSTVITCRGGHNYIAGGAIYYRVMVSDNVSLHNFASHIGFRLSTKASRLAETLSIKSNRDQGNYLPVPVEEVRAIGLPYRRYILNHIHGRPYTRGKLAIIDDPAVDRYARYHWDRVLSVKPSGRSVEVFDVMDQPEQRFEAAGFVVHNCELRVLAELSGDPGFVDAFQSGGDLHSLTASQMFGVPLAEVQKPQRNAAKAINFGLAYGMGPGGLAPRLGVTLDESKELISRYFKAYPGVQKWLDKAAKDAVRNGYSATTLGRKRFYNIPDENLRRISEDDWRKQIAAIERQGKNSPIQGANADMTKIALIYLRTALKGWDARTVNTVHDEIVVEAREDQAEEVKHIVEDAMVRAGQVILKVVPIVAEASLADYWSK